MPLLDPHARLELMREAARTFAESDTAADAAQQLAELVVPRFADWCAVDFMADGELVRLAVAHRDPAMVKLAREYQERWPPDPNGPSGAPAVIRSGEPEIVEEIPEGMLAELLDDPEQIAAIEALGLHSYAVLPLNARGISGALSLVQAESGRQFGPDHVEGLQDLAALAAIAMGRTLVATELRRARDEADGQARMTQQVFDHLPTLAWAARPDGYIDRYNRSWYEYTGTTAEAMEGWGWESVHDPELLPEVKERWTECLASGEPFEMEFTLLGADGVRRWFLTRARPIRDEAGTIIRWLGTNTDIDQLKQTHALVDMIHEQSAVAIESMEAMQARIDELEGEKKPPGDD